MIDIAYLENIKLRSIPRAQQIIALFLLTPNYHFFSKVVIKIEHIELIPRDDNVIFAMNHTDRYNYWPFQYKLWKEKTFPFTTAWVKGEYYRNPIVAKIFNLCSLIPVPSIKYFVQEFFLEKFGRRIRDEEYRALKNAIDGKTEGINVSTIESPELDTLSREHFVDYIVSYYEKIMEKVAQLSEEALFVKNLNLIIFPEGTRSTKLAAGRTGLAQLALHTGKTIIPVGCNNSEQVYPGDLPFARSGTIVYRIGEPLSMDGKLKPYRIRENFKPFSPEAKSRYAENFEGVTRLVMESIHTLIDQRYKDLET
ncbi:MAG TPA: 1-acyl-sn-glycerol-3-phosphate acyltransferase [Desulfobacteraceae bacterium]|nr:1-acyl-sn-glycerol-3-phosphate acyltransferase [Desulfobacteraceae bacterium]